MYAPELTNNEAGISKYVLTLIVNEVLSLLMNGLYEAFWIYRLIVSELWSIS